MSDSPIFSRRKVLAATGGIAGLTGVGYVGARRIARKGVINVRLIIGEELDGRTIVGEEQLFVEQLDSDGPPDRRFNPDYRQYFPEEPPITVSQSVHQELQQEFDRVVYALSHNCPDASCSTPRVSRHDFNSVRVGDEVRLLYHSGDSATIIS